jgi:gliding motility-associated lipoprotein GldH
MQNAKLKMQKRKKNIINTTDLLSPVAKGETLSGKMLSKQGFLLFACCMLHFAFASCTRPSPQYQDHYNVPGGQWNSNFRPEFKFVIDDTTAAYQLQLLLRHTDAYPFSNIWINMESRAPGDTSFGKVRVEIPLAAPSGQWLGKGFGELYEQRVPITSLSRPAFFARRGEYVVRISQDMRRNPLPEVLIVGLRLEKLPPFKRK